MLSLRITNLSSVAPLRWPHSAQQFVDSMIGSLGPGNTLPFNISLGAASPVQPILLSAGDTKFDTTRSLSTSAIAGLAVGLFFLGVLVTLLVLVVVKVVYWRCKQGRKYDYVELPSTASD